MSLKEHHGGEKKLRGHPVVILGYDGIFTLLVMGESSNRVHWNAEAIPRVPRKLGGEEPEVFEKALVPNADFRLMISFFVRCQRQNVF